jgi:hypothetical protein
MDCKESQRSDAPYMHPKPGHFGRVFLAPNAFSDLFKVFDAVDIFIFWMDISEI